MSVNPQTLPGMTEYPPHTLAKIIPYCSLTTDSTVNTKTIVVTGCSFTKSGLFNNGLGQNVYVIYKMFEAMGYCAIVLVDKIQEDESLVPSYIKNVRMLTLEQFVKIGIKVDIILEIGMSVDPTAKKLYKEHGTKIFRLYLGNILNIDIETPFMYPGLYFPHHVQGCIDASLVSPHYTQHSQYASIITQSPVKNNTVNVAPYLWDPTVLTNQGQRTFRWTPCEPGNEIFIVVEPNISFQKTSLIPLCIVEKWYRNNPKWKGKLVIINGHIMKSIPYFNSSIESSFDIIKDGHVEFRNRMSIIEILTEFPSAIPICYQWNNEYNYMILEYFHSLYPVLHNVSDWKNYGYYYENSNIKHGAELIEKVVHKHKDSLEIYTSHVHTILWRHSPYNSENHTLWNTCLNCV
jgi:hypothetical protein